MIPIHDDNPTAIRPVVTIGIIAACTLVFLWQLGRAAEELNLLFYSLGFIPALLFGDAELPPDVVLVSPSMSVLTSMFLHGGFMHLAGNMLYLWVFGNNVEDAMGHARFGAFYVLCGIAAAMAQGLADPGSTVPMVGASGAIGGVLGAYLLLHPRARILVIIPLGIILQPLRIPAYFVLGLWFVFQLLAGGTSLGQEGGVAYWAHVGGFLAGAALLFPFKRRGVPLLDRGNVRRPPPPGPPPGARGPWG